MVQLIVVTLVISVAVAQTAIAQQSENSTCAAVTKCLARLDKGFACGAIPVPARAQTFPVTTPYKLQKLRKGVWVISDLAYLSMIVRWKSRVVLIDAPDSPGGLNKPDGSRTRLTDIIETVLNGTTLRVLDIVYTHAHYDHIGAATRVVQWSQTLKPAPKVRVFGAANVVTLVERSVTKRAVIPTHIIPDEGRNLYIRPGLRIKMKFVDGHTDRDLAVHIPRSRSESGILMHVDVVFPRFAPFWSLAITDDVGRYISVFDDLLKYEFHYFVSGHIRLGTRMDVEEGSLFTKDLLNAALVAPSLVRQEDLDRVGFGNAFNPTAKEYGNLWFLVITAGRDLQADACSRIMIEKWGCRIGGISETIQSSCFAMLTYIGVAY